MQCDVDVNKKNIFLKKWVSRGDGIKNKCDDIILDQTEVMNFWKEYFKDFQRNDRGMLKSKLML